MPLRFETEPPVEAPAPNRMDVACFVGFVRPRTGASSGAIQRWLGENGWLQSPSGLRMPYARTSAATYLDVPIPIERWAVFDRLFAWDERAMEGTDARATTYLGAAVRSFFAEGGKRCYVVRAGDDWPVPAGITAETDAQLATTRFDRLQAIVPGYPGSTTASPADRTTWHGVGHVFGLPDVSFICCPDLPDIVRAAAVPPDLRVTLPPVSEQFVECTSNEPIDDDDPAHRYHAPRAGDAEYAVWQQVVELVRNALIGARCETQFIATAPLPVTGSTAERTLSDLLSGNFLREGNTAGGPRVSSFVQLVFPWVVTRGSRGLPEGLEPAEGALAGVLARNALSRGTFRSAAGLPLAAVDDTQPALSQSDVGERVSLLGPTPRGMQVLTDVTASGSEQYRPAGVHRLVSAIVRAAR
ncbi:MAG TPA: hypothetical protein VK636_05945, partial [Gemmatimonadaceae bacterium]|nr:hypothetical protein [Gemmatimonadaceae bacterium]